MRLKVRFERSVEWAELPAISQTVARRSAAAEYGRKRIGAVPLPKPLIDGISEIVQGASSRKQIDSN